MTLKEKEEKEYEVRSYIADRFRDIQRHSQFLKVVEDEQKTKQTLLKITDIADEIRRGYATLDELSVEIPEEEPEEDDFFADDGFDAAREQLQNSLYKR